MQKTALKIVKKLRDAGFETYFAGGYVRDLIMGKKEIAKDLDLFSQRSNLRVLYPNEAVFKSFISLMNSEPKIYVYDLFLVAYMKTYKIKTIISDDTDFEEIKDIEVLNPF